jgi:hypothetical protein
MVRQTKEALRCEYLVWNDLAMKLNCLLIAALSSRAHSALVRPAFRSIRAVSASTCHVRYPPLRAQSDDDDEVDWSELVPPADIVADLKRKNAPSQQGRQGSEVAVMGFFAALALSFAAILTRTLVNHPIFPFQPNSAAWSYSWLMTTIFDYYGAALSLCAVILSSENRVPGILWSLGCCLLGTPICCFWIISRILRNGSLRIA